MLIELCAKRNCEARDGPHVVHVQKDGPDGVHLHHEQREAVKVLRCEVPVLECWLGQKVECP